MARSSDPIRRDLPETNRMNFRKPPARFHLATSAASLNAPEFRPSIFPSADEDLSHTSYYQQLQVPQ